MKQKMADLTGILSTKMAAKLISRTKAEKTIVKVIGKSNTTTPLDYTRKEH